MQLANILYVSSREYLLVLGELIHFDFQPWELVGNVLFDLLVVVGLLELHLAFCLQLGNLDQTVSM